MRKLKTTLNADRYTIILADIAAVFASAFGWLLIRFDLFLVPAEYAHLVLVYLIPDTIITLLVFHFFKLYHSVWRFASIDEMIKVFQCVIVITLIQLIYKVNVPLSFAIHVPWSFYFLNPLLMFIFASFIRMSVRLQMRFIRRNKPPTLLPHKIMIVGAGQAAMMLIDEIQGRYDGGFKIVAAIDDNPSKMGKYVHGIPVVGNREKIISIAVKYDIDEIIIAMPSASPEVISDLVEICNQTDSRVRILPEVASTIKGILSDSIRDVSYEDLLSRKSIQKNHDYLMETFRDKTVLVTGGGGSIGSELCRQIALLQPKQIIIFDIYENGAYNLQTELERKLPGVKIKVIIGSVRDTKRVNNIFETYMPHYVFHAAAHKHVPLMEASPAEAIKNNCRGTLNVCRAADHYGTKILVLVSTDKAVRPTNIMGASKRIAEMIMQYYSKQSNTCFAAVRFGNVLGSEGSVVPLFLRQIEEGGPVTLTHKDITRYFMTIPEAVSLILDTTHLAKGGEIFVLDMGKQVRIYDMAEKLIRLKGLRPGKDIEIKIIGLRPGEKLYEELLLAEEGICKTDNSLIFIGKPSKFEHSDFMLKLEELIRAADENSLEIKELTRKICVTFVDPTNMEN